MNTFDLGILIKNTLLTPEKSAFQTSIEKLIQKNQGEALTSHYMFMFEGAVYKKASLKKHMRGAPSLNPDLVAEMQETLKMFQNSKRDVQSIWQALLPIVEVNGINDGLPDCLRTILPTSFSPRTISFEDAIQKCPEIVGKNWLATEKLLYYFISIRLAL